ncbi:MAG TPA: NAD(P)-dependent oxidoreductase [Gemmatimonadaceae bacterium]|jgi:3-hydroxyisobutyrate dehydrogenase-like beta-hydroxyacid dehydrogenase
MADQIAFLGTGRLGAGFVEAALGRGDRVTVWNRTPEKAQALASFGATVATTPAEAVRGAVRVHLVLKDDAAVEQVIADCRSGLGREAIILDHTTTQPALTAERATRLNAEGVKYLHCPVFIGPAAARQARGNILVSGPQALFDAVKPALERQAARVVYYGPRPDFAAVIKLIGNAYLIGTGAVMADFMSIARSAGVSAEQAMSLFDFFDPANIVQTRGVSMMQGDFTPSFELAMARKDVKLMIETAGDRPLAALPSLAARMDALIAAGHGGEDFAVLAIDAMR